MCQWSQWIEWLTILSLDKKVEVLGKEKVKQKSTKDWKWMNKDIVIYVFIYMHT